MDPARRGAPSRSGGCTQPARCAPRWRSMLYVQCCTPPPSSPETGVCVEIRWWQPGRYFGRRGLVVAVGDAHQIRMLTRAILVCAESWRCCTSDNRAFATILPGLDLCFVGWCWLGGWAFITSVEGDGIVQHHMSILTRAFLVCSEFRAALAVCCCRKSRFILFRLGDESRVEGGCSVGGGVFLRAASARHRSVVPPGLFSVCSSLASPPSPVLFAPILGRVPLFAFPGVRQCVGIQRLPGPVSAAHRGLPLGGTVWVHYALGALLGGLHPTKRSVLPGAVLQYLRGGLGGHSVVG